MGHIDSIGVPVVTATPVNGLIGEAAVVLAVRQAVPVAVPAIVEAACARLALWPFAHGVAQLHERYPEAYGDDDVLKRNQ